MTSAAAGESDVVVLPTGSTEQHAEHLPVSVETLRAESPIRELVEAGAKTPQDHRRYEVRQYACFEDITSGGGLGGPTGSDPGFVEAVIEDLPGGILEALRRGIEALRGIWRQGSATGVRGGRARDDRSRGPLVGDERPA